MTPYLGQIMTVGFNFAPKTWQLCAGQLLAIQSNQALFSILGTTYGGNGIQTFALPDLRGRVPIHWGQGPGQPYYNLGETGGTETTTLLSNNLPLHNHAMSVNNATPNNAAPSGNYLAKGAVINNANALLYTTSAANTTMAASAISSTGSNQPVSVIQPYLTINYVIALSGIFPSRN
jgi:microcystin-dependent protein